jgi:ABC-type transport system involved in cytochrome c biogenesis ATPase subunit
MSDHTPATAHASSLLSVQDLHFAWPQGQVFEGLHLDLMPGLNWLVGDEGQGKTTLMRLLAADLPLQQGQIRWGDEAQASQAGDVFWVNPQSAAFDATSVSDCFQQWARRFPRWRNDQLPALIEGFDLQEHLSKTLHMLSAGSKRKVWLSAAWASGARVVLIEQPFAALDAPSIRFLRGLLEQAAHDHERCWLVADHVAPEALLQARVITL